MKLSIIYAHGMGEFCTAQPEAGLFAGQLQASSERTEKLVAVVSHESQMPETNHSLADDSTGDSNIKKPLLLLKGSICMGCLDPLMHL